MGDLSTWILSRAVQESFAQHTRLGEDDMGHRGGRVPESSGLWDDHRGEAMDRGGSMMGFGGLGGFGRKVRFGVERILRNPVLGQERFLKS